MKLLRLFLITLLAIAIGACGGAATVEKKTDDSADKETAEKQEDAEKKEDAPKSDAAAGSPTEAIASFIKAFEAKDVDGVKKHLSKQTLDGMEQGAKQAKKPLDDMLKDFVNLDMPFKGTPEMRNEKIDGDKATVEVNADGKWESTPLVKEDGMWKMDFANAKR